MLIRLGPLTLKVRDQQINPAASERCVSNCQCGRYETGTRGTVVSSDISNMLLGAVPSIDRVGRAQSDLAT